MQRLIKLAIVTIRMFIEWKREKRHRFNGKEKEHRPMMDREQNCDFKES